MENYTAHEVNRVSTMAEGEVMAKYIDTFLETTDPKYARKMSKRVGKKTSIKTMGKLQRAGTVGGLGFPSYLVRFRREK